MKMKKILQKSSSFSFYGTIIIESNNDTFPSAVFPYTWTFIYLQPVKKIIEIIRMADFSAQLVHDYELNMLLYEYVL